MLYIYTNLINLITMTFEFHPHKTYLWFCRVSLNLTGIKFCKTPYGRLHGNFLFISFDIRT